MTVLLQGAFALIVVVFFGELNENTKYKTNIYLSIYLL